MTDTNAGSGRRRRSRRSCAKHIVKEPQLAIRQLQAKQLRNRFAPIEALDAEQMNALHNASMQLLEEQGIEVMGEQALALFREAGASVDEQGLVKIDRALLMDTVAQAPASFTLTPRNSDRAILVGENVINFGLVSGAPNVHDTINGRRAGNLEDYKKIVSLGQYFNVLSFFVAVAVADALHAYKRKRIEKLGKEEPELEPINYS